MLSYQQGLDNGERTLQKASIQDLQFQICSSYIRFASEKLAARQGQLLAQTSQLLASFHPNQHYKNFSFLGDTQADGLDISCDSILNQSICCPKIDQPHGRKSAFKRKSKFGMDHYTQGNLYQALQQVKDLCSLKTLGVLEQFVNEYRRISGQLALANRQAVMKKQSLNCSACIGKDQQFQLKNRQLQEKIITLRIEVQIANQKIKTIAQTFQARKQSDNELAQKNKKNFQNCRQYLSQKEQWIASKTVQLRSLEQNISIVLEKITDLGGCQRCQVIRHIKNQIVQMRRFYENECQILQKKYLKYRNILQ